MYEIAIQILNKLEDNGYNAYIIGGYVRDKLLNIENNDIDICTSAYPNKIKELFNVIEDNSKFGSLKILENNYIYEITTFRKDTYTNNRYPRIEFTNSLDEDLKRRDFTINTICIDSDNNYIDLYNGIEDINKKVIKMVGDPNTKLKEDPLRILRAIRFAGKLNFSLNKELKDSIIENKELINTLSKNKIKEEVDKMNQKSLDMLKELKVII